MITNKYEVEVQQERHRLIMIIGLRHLFETIQYELNLLKIRNLTTMMVGVNLPLPFELKSGNLKIRRTMMVGDKLPLGSMNLKFKTTRTMMVVIGVHLPVLLPLPLPDQTVITIIITFPPLPLDLRMVIDQGTMMMKIIMRMMKLFLLLRLIHRMELISLGLG